MQRPYALLFLLSGWLLSCKKQEPLYSSRCKLVPEAGNCRAAIPRYYYDAQEKRCKEFTWGGCGGVVPFETLEECQECGCDKFNNK